MQKIFDAETQEWIEVKPDKNELFKGFTDDQLYILKRQAIHASRYMMSMAYTATQKEMHTVLLNAIISELRRRAIYHDEKEALIDTFTRGENK